jgi:Protein of unknown function (DUF1553)/Protein of unknown function (DUF1549)
LNSLHDCGASVRQRVCLTCTLAVLAWCCAFTRVNAAETVAPDKTATEKEWAYRAPVRPMVPAVKNASWGHNPIDAFILAKQEAAGLACAPVAEPAVLIRRLSFDLTGLPPTPEEVDAFVHDASPDAYEKLVDRLLAAPQHGERLATPWLDLVRFAESDGFKADDRRPEAWRYRDYVIRSFNADKPYDRFIQEQLAGDELFPDDPDALIATGLNRHPPDEYNAVNLEQRRQEILNDLTDTTSLVFLGLTVGCARCHDHKFDPIAQTDYYRIQAFFAAYQPADRPVGKHAELERFQQRMRDWLTKTADLRKRMDELEEPYREQFLAKRKGRFPKEYQEMFDTPADKRTPLQQQIAAMVAKQVEIGHDEVAKTMKPAVRQQWQELDQTMAELNRLKPPSPPLAMALTDVGPVAPVTHLLRRGEWQHPGEEIVPGFLSAIDDRSADVPPPGPDARTTGRRSILARWLTQPDHPLTARVLVNRLWQHHFGRGIVATPSDFGNQGEPPTHPELLDWLAREFVERGWSMKAIHRLIVTSATYRQSTHFDRANAALDPENKLLWRMNRRRLEGEALRDAMLAVSGQLNAKAGGPSIYPELPPELGMSRGSWPVSSDASERNRRSVYVFVKRNLRYPLFSAFDAPDTNETCARRQLTTNAPQALALLNGKTVLDQARLFGARVLREAGTDPTRVIDRAYRVSLGRAPDAEEMRATQSFLDREATLLRQRLGGNVAGHDSPADPAFAAAVVDLCHALLNLNEFLYLD